ncbi:Protein FAM172A [Takifugu flavidus]|uniref:Protein FAM172A n=1 Tax=Takifugu flavidus TaxID=433684 RepID=A0A5C6MY06_9TELE|nr:Protein FAM172A [Takifugu flavidus]
MGGKAKKSSNWGKKGAGTCLALVLSPVVTRLLESHHALVTDSRDCLSSFPPADGQLRHTETGEPFVFNAREDLHRWNQKRYEALGEIITLYVYELLEKTCNMTKAILPVDASPDEPTSFIYLTPDALLNPSKLLVLIQGSGVERAGQWARRLIINQDLDSGTQIPFITRAIQARVDVVMMYGWSVLPLLKAPPPAVHDHGSSFGSGARVRFCEQIDDPALLPDFELQLTWLAVQSGKAAFVPQEAKVTASIRRTWHVGALGFFPQLGSISS